LVESGLIKCTVLDLIATHPSYQKRGLGKRLMDYGTGIADEMRVPAYIDGTLLAKKLYESTSPPFRR
jgi:ribosomal protein S18 acetylase RimI-like enzyme